jgi:hypothetical protein
MLRHSVALVLNAEQPKQALKDASFYGRAMVGFERSMGAVAVAAALKKGGMRKLAGQTAKRRAAVKSKQRGQTTNSPPVKGELGQARPGILDAFGQLHLWPENASSEAGAGLEATAEQHQPNQAGASKVPVKEQAATSEAAVFVEIVVEADVSMAARLDGVAPNARVLATLVRLGSGEWRFAQVFAGTGTV